LLGVAAALSRGELIGEPADTIIVSFEDPAAEVLRPRFEAARGELLPGELVLVPNTPITLGAGTNEDWSLVVERSAVQLIGGTPTGRVFEEVGSSTLAIRFSAHADAALAVLNAKAVARITGGVPPSGF